MNDIATVGDLIAALTDCDPTTPIRIATDSAAFTDHTIGRVVHPGDPDSDCAPPTGTPVARIGTGEAYCRPPDSAADALEWS